tara:strand:+ start:375 stop:833 length:459 start_codon:yes stop_codon:yes gene_type:complete
MSITNNTPIRSINNTSDDRVRLESPIVELPTGTVNLTPADSGVIYTLKANSSYVVILPLESVEIGTKITIMNSLNSTLSGTALEIYSDLENENVGINLLSVNGSAVSFIDSNSGLANYTGDIPKLFKAELVYSSNNVWKGTVFGSSACLDEV